MWSILELYSLLYLQVYYLYLRYLQIKQLLFTEDLAYFCFTIQRKFKVLNILESFVVVQLQI